MIAVLSNYYGYFEAFHILSVIAWMAGMLYLPRLFVNHAGLTAGSEASEMLKGMEQRLLRIIMTPAMISTWLFGLLILWSVDFNHLYEGWMHMKLACVLAMSGLHGFFAATVRRFVHDQNARPARFYRILNEVPTVLLIAIVLLVVLQPF